MDGEIVERTRAVMGDEAWVTIARKLLATFCDIQAIVFYGSRVVGRHGPDSDYDVLVISRETLPSRDELETVTDELGRELGAPVDINVATVRGAVLHRLLDPYFNAALATGVTVGEPGPLREPRYLARRGCVDALVTSEVEMDAADEREGESRRRGYLQAYARLLLLDQFLSEGAYRPHDYHDRMAEARELPAEELRSRCRGLWARLKPVVDTQEENAGDRELEEMPLGSPGRR